LTLAEAFIIHQPPEPIFVTGTKKWPNSIVYGLTAKGHDRLAVLEREDLFGYIKEQVKEQGSSFVFSFGKEIASSWLKNTLGLSAD